MNDMNSIFSGLLGFQKIAPVFLEKCCVVNGGIMPLDEMEQMGFQEFSRRAREYMPIKLYKYFPNITTEKKNPDTGETENINYSLKSLFHNEVYLNNPLFFDDVYDSDIHIDFIDYSAARLDFYGSLCNCPLDDYQKIEDKVYHFSCKLYSAITSERSMFSLFKIEEQQKGVYTSVEAFLLEIEIALKEGNSWHEAIERALTSEYQDLLQSIKSAFRISCFTTSPFSQRMWAESYGNKHTGFCAEYTIDHNNPVYESLVNNLYPVVYCKTRAEMTKRLLHYQDAQITEQTIWDIYFNGILRKPIDWADQTEWRLLMPASHKQPGYTLPFFPITKVYLGNRMDVQHRQQIIDICHERNIPYAGVTRSSTRFEMQECPTLCENCFRFQNPKQSNQ